MQLCGAQRVCETACSCHRAALAGRPLECAEQSTCECEHAIVHVRERICASRTGACRLGPTA